MMSQIFPTLARASLAASASAAIALWSWTGSRTSFTSTLSTRTPHGSVASSSNAFMIAEIISLWDKISDRFFVPRTFLSVVAASSWVEWLHCQHHSKISIIEKTISPEIINTTEGQLSCDNIEVNHGIYSDSHRVTGENLARWYKNNDKRQNATSCGGTSNDTVRISTHLKLSTHGMIKNIPGPWNSKIVLD